MNNTGQLLSILCVVIACHGVFIACEVSRVATNLVTLIGIVREIEYTR